MAESAGLLFKIGVDGGNSLGTLKEFRKAVKDIEDEAGVGATKMERFASSAGLSAEQFTYLKGKIADFTAIGAGITAVAGAAVGLTAALYATAKSAADYGSAIFDATQRTGQSAETMSALKYAADTSGSSLEAITASVSKFNVLVGQAATGNEKARGVLEQYGITATNTDQALVQAIRTIGEMTDSSQQAAAATALFKDRTGEILPVIKSFNGDLPGLIRNLQDMGLIMSGEDAEAADKFGDQMDTLDKQLMQVKNTLGRELIPVFLEFSTKLSDWLSRNKGEVKSWAESITSTFRNMLLQMQQEANDAGAIGDFFDVLFGGGTGTDLQNKWANRRLESQRIINARANKNPDYSGVNEQPNDLTDRLPSPTSATVDAASAKKAADEAEKRRKEREKAFQDELTARGKQLQLLLRQTHDEFTALNEEWERGFLAGEKTKEEFRNASLNNIAAYGQKAQQLLDKQRDLDLKNAKTGTDKDNAIIEYQTASAALNRELVKEREDTEKTITGIVDKETKKRTEIQRESLDVQKEISQTRQAQLQTDLKLGLINEQQYIALLYKEKVAILESEAAATESLNQRRIIQEKINQLKQQEAQAVIDLAEKQKKANDEYWAGQLDSISRVAAELNTISQNLLGPPTAGAVSGGAEAEKGYGPFQGLAESWQNFVDLINDTGPTLGQTVEAIGGMMTAAFDDFANALGNVVQQWVLTGETGPAVMRKILASALATLAAEAAVRALWELALGFASLFFNPAEAAAHFTAAAIFGTIAGVAAVAGRAVAGDAFKKQASTKSSSAATSPQSSSTEGQGNQYSKYGTKAAILDEGRTAPGEGQPVKVTVHVDDDSRWLGKMLTFDVETNGQSRRYVG